MYPRILLSRQCHLKPSFDADSLFAVTVMKKMKMSFMLTDEKRERESAVMASSLLWSNTTPLKFLLARVLAQPYRGYFFHPCLCVCVANVVGVQGFSPEDTQVCFSFFFFLINWHGVAFLEALSGLQTPQSTLHVCHIHPFTRIHTLEAQTALLLPTLLVWSGKHSCIYPTSRLCLQGKSGVQYISQGRLNTLLVFLSVCPTVNKVTQKPLGECLPYYAGRSI